MEKAVAGNIPEDFIYSDDNSKKWLTGPNEPTAQYWEMIEKGFNGILQYFRNVSIC